MTNKDFKLATKQTTNFKRKSRAWNPCSQINPANMSNIWCTLGIKTKSRLQILSNNWNVKSLGWKINSWALDHRFSLILKINKIKLKDYRKYSYHYMRRVIRIGSCRCRWNWVMRGVTLHRLGLSVLNKIKLTLLTNSGMISCKWWTWQNRKLKGSIQVRLNRFVELSYKLKRRWNLVLSKRSNRLINLRYSTNWKDSSLTNNSTMFRENWRTVKQVAPIGRTSTK